MNLTARRPVPLLRAAGVAAVCALGVGCGGVAAGVRSTGGSNDRAPAAVGDVVPVRDGIYCRTVAGNGPIWIAGGGAHDFEQYWSARRAHEHAATITAPGQIAEAWTTIATFTRDIATPMVEAGDLSAPPTEPSVVVGDRARVAAFDRDVCGVGVRPA